MSKKSGRNSRVVWPGFSYKARTRHIAHVGRNDPCPCGSGHKYKECHEQAGKAFLEKIARREELARWRESRAPWYVRLFGALRGLRH